MDSFSAALQNYNLRRALGFFMEIILIRHGKPESATNPLVTSGGYANWVRRYNQSSVACDSRPPSQLRDRLNNHYIVSSDLRRAVESAEICSGQTPKEKHPILREMDIPRYRMPFKFRAWTWLYLSRFLWTLGVKGTFESYKEARLRSKTACQKLIQLACKHDKIVVFGHGYMNLHIRKELISNGWSMSEKSNKY